MNLIKLIENTVKDVLKEEESLENIKLNDNFWKWFGNSKVVDKNGNPMICYHGTKSPSKFNIFNISDGFYGKGIYFFDNEKSSNIFGKTIKCYLKIENPFIETFYRSYYNIPLSNTIEKTKFLKEKGYDGIMADTIIIVFSSNQIKSIENDGSWDLNNNNIYS